MPSRADGNEDESTPLLSIRNVVGTNHLAKFTDDDRPAYVKYPSKVLNTVWQTVKCSPANILLPLVPVGIIAGISGWDPVAIFVLNFLAIIPLAAVLAFATEELAAKLGSTIGGLMNATFGNAVELIVSIIALREGQIRVVQSSMLGSILSNLLLVLGCCFIAGGIGDSEREFNTTVASTMSSLMIVSTASLIIPAALAASMGSSGLPGKNEDNILLLSRGTAIILLFLYVMYLYFQLRSHAYLFDESEAKPGNDEESAVTNEPAEEENDDEVQEGDTLPPISAGICLVIVTLLVAVCADYLVGSIDAIVERTNISKTFIGLILLPIVGNAAEHVTAVVVSYKGKMNLALGVAVGSSMQIALFVTPFLVIMGWIMHKDMTLKFQGFETVVFFLSVLVVNYLIGDGKSNYLEGLMCLGTYTIIALAFFVYPDNVQDTDVGSMAKSFFEHRG